MHPRRGDASRLSQAPRCQATTDCVSLFNHARTGQGLHRLAELVSKGGCIHAECQCGRVALFNTRELLAQLTRKGSTAVWPGFAHKLRCTECGARGPRVS